jgi:hypothetical protein
MKETTPSAEVPDAGPAGPSSPIVKLSDAQVFARDPEDYTEENTADTIERLRKILARHRKARQDAEQVMAEAAKLKKANAKPKKAATTKAKPSLAADPLETKI